MRKLIRELSHVVAEHFYVENKFDLTLVLSKEDVLSLSTTIDVGKYDTSTISLEGGEYFYISSLVEGKESELYIESVFSNNGSFKHDVGNVVLIPSYVPNELVVQLLENDYELVLQVEEESTYEEIAYLIAEIQNLKTLI